MFLQFRLDLPCPAVAALVCALGMASACGESHKPLPKLTEVPAFSLQDQRGGQITRKGLSGSVWVANFIFTSCKDVCPLLTKKMADVRLGLVRDGVPVQFVSFSVDPATDTPEVLRAFAQKHQSLHDDWHFLTGAMDDVRRVVQEGFRQRMDRDPNEPANVFHGSHFVLVDQAGVIRGFYRSEYEGLLDLARDAARLAKDSEG